MYLTINDNYGIIKEVETLQGKYEVIGDVDYITQIETKKPHLISYDKKTNIALTTRPEALQEYINSFRNAKNYKFIFKEV